MDEKEKNEKVAKMVDSLELHQLQKLAARARAGEELSAADLALLKRLGGKLEATRPPATATVSKKKRGRPTAARHLADKIERLAMEKILERLERGDKLTAAEFAFLAKMRQGECEKNSGVKPPEKLTLAERLQVFKEKGFESLCWVAESSKSHMARVSAVQTLKKWADEMEMPLEPYELVDAHPENEPFPTAVTNEPPWR